MSDALPIPPRPNPDYYRALARDLSTAAGRDGIHDWAARWIASLTARQPIDWPAEGQTPQIRIVEFVERQWARFVHAQLKDDVASLKLTDAQFFLARIHGFESWPRFAHHIEAMADGDSLTSAFEAAADAIVAGNIERVRVLLDGHPGLGHHRSTRDHHSTLLHYVSANGVEDFRQRTPPNIVAIAELLLDRGADVNAESEAYGGHSTTLGLAATSLHPEKAGVQIALLDLLLARGARIEQRGQTGTGMGAVIGCLANGQGSAARFLASRGASLDLEGAAGVNRADIVATYFDEHHVLTKGATAEQRDRAVMYATGYGADDALRLLLANGGDPDGRNQPPSPWGGQTPLHWTTYGPHVGAAAQLIAAGATIDARDDRWHATPLDWALHAWVNEWNPAAREQGYELIERLVGAGAVVHLDGQDEKTKTALRSDARMRTVLSLDT
jgi:ankyrin repeat protein